MTEKQNTLKCAEWLTYCLSIGWDKDLLPKLEKIWKDNHDENGNIKKGSAPIKEVKEDDELVDMFANIEVNILYTDENNCSCVATNTVTNHSAKKLAQIATDHTNEQLSKVIEWCDAEIKRIDEKYHKLIDSEHYAIHKHDLRNEQDGKKDGIYKTKQFILSLIKE